MKAVILLLILLANLSSPAFAKKAIDFQFTDVSGSALQLIDFRGKWVLVNFWAPWCPLSWKETPVLNALNKRDNFVVLSVSLDYGPDASVVPAYAKAHDFHLSAIIAGGSRSDPNSAFRQVGPVDFYPTSYLFDPTGEIAMFIPGTLNKDKMLAFMLRWDLARLSGKKIAQSASAQ
jgi:thiol-disulfide isomerase/thioredoxin